MKSIKYSLMMVLLFSVSQVQAEQKQSMALELARINKMDKVIDRMNSIYEYANSYILQTAKIDITKNNLKTTYNLTDRSFEGYDKNSVITPSYADEHIIFSNAMPVHSSSRFDNVVKNSNTLDVRADYNQTARTFSYRASDDVRLFLDEKKFLHDVTVSQNQPADTSKAWYKPDGKGSFKIYNYVDDAWKLGLDDAISISSNSGVKVLKTVAELQVLKLSRGSIVYVENNQSMDAYIMGKDGWAKEITTSKNSLATAKECTAKTLGAIKISKEDGCTQFCANNSGTPAWKCFGGTGEG